MLPPGSRSGPVRTGEADGGGRCLLNFRSGASPPLGASLRCSVVRLAPQQMQRAADRMDVWPLGRASPRRHPVRLAMHSVRRPPSGTCSHALCDASQQCCIGRRERRKAVRPSARARCWILLFNPIPHSHGVSSVPERAGLRVAVSYCGLPRVAETWRQFACGQNKTPAAGPGRKTACCICHRALGRWTSNARGTFARSVNIARFPSINSSPGWIEDFRLQAVDHARHASKSGSRICSGSRCFRGLQTALSDSAG
jgi:hypothetical protein